MKGLGRKLREARAGQVSDADEAAPAPGPGARETSLVVHHFDPSTRFQTFRTRFSDPVGYLNEVGVERCYELASRGMDVTEIARLLRVSNFALNAWLDAGSNRRGLLEDAWRVAAGMLAFEGATVLKNAPPIAYEVTRANHIAAHNRWLASKLDPARFGDKQPAAGSAGAAVGLVLNVTMADGSRQTIQATAVTSGEGAAGGDSQPALPGVPPPYLPGVRLVPVD